MSCEEASKKLAEALNAYVRVEKKLAPLVLSHIVTPERRAQPAVPASEKVAAGLQPCQPPARSASCRHQENHSPRGLKSAACTQAAR